MQLLTPKEAKQSFENKKASNLAEVGYLEKTLNSLQKRANDENNAFERRLKEQRELYGAEKIKLQDELRSLEQIVTNLRQERKGLMIPINTLKVEVEGMHKEVKEKLAQIELKEIELEGLVVNAQNRLDAISEKEIIIKEQEVSLALRKQGIDAESEQVSNSHKKLNEMMSNFNTEVNKKTKEIADKLQAVEIRENKNRAYLQEREKKLLEKEIKVEDQRKLLEREFIKLNKK